MSLNLQDKAGYWRQWNAQTGQWIDAAGRSIPKSDMPADADAAVTRYQAEQQAQAESQRAESRRLDKAVSQGDYGPAFYPARDLPGVRDASGKQVTVPAYTHGPAPMSARIAYGVVRGLRGAADDFIGPKGAVTQGGQALVAGILRAWGTPDAMHAAESFQMPHIDANPMPPERPDDLAGELADGGARGVVLATPYARVLRPLAWEQPLAYMTATSAAAGATAEPAKGESRTKNAIVAGLLGAASERVPGLWRGRAMVNSPIAGDAQGVLSGAEKEEISRYTSTMAKQNTGLRDTADEAEKSSRMSAPDIYKLQSALSKLPPVRGTVWRYTNLPDHVANDIAPGQTMDAGIFTSTSKSKSATSSFGNVQLKILSKSGREIPNGLTPFSYEQEVVFPPQSKFSVKNVVRDGAGNVKRIELEEIDTPQTDRLLNNAFGDAKLSRQITATLPSVAATDSSGTSKRTAVRPTQ